MGRGRQKAKHTKIARQLKSFSPDVNYDALERELAAKDSDSEDYIDRWAEFVDDDSDDDTTDEDEADTYVDEAKGA